MVKYIFALVLATGLFANVVPHKGFKLERVYKFQKELGEVSPSSIALDKQNGLLVTDSKNHRVLLLEWGSSKWIALNSGGNSADRDGVLSDALFAIPKGLAISDQDILLADFGNHKVKKITTNEDDELEVTTIAGSGNAGNSTGFATRSNLNEPSDLLLAKNGVLVSDQQNSQIKLIESDQLKTFAGSEFGFEDGYLLSAKFATPAGMCQDKNGDIFVADTLNHAVRKITPDQLITVAGAGVHGYKDGKNSLLSFPLSVACGDGFVLVADTKNKAIRTLTDSGLKTAIGGFKKIVTRLDAPIAVTITPEKRVFVLDKDKVLQFSYK